MSFKLIFFYKTILVLHHHFEMAGIHFYFRNSSAQNNLDFEFTYPICTRLNRTHFFVIKCVFGALKSSNLLFRIGCHIWMEQLIVTMEYQMSMECSNKIAMK